jgi:hypothetical protein
MMCRFDQFGSPESRLLAALLPKLLSGGLGVSAAKLVEATA